MTDEERFQLLFEDETYCITDTKDLKTLEEFIEDIKEDYIEDGYSIVDVHNLASENYDDYLYENSMTGKEITNTLNTLHGALTEMKENGLKVLSFYQDELKKTTTHEDHQRIMDEINTVKLVLHEMGVIE